MRSRFRTQAGRRRKVGNGKRGASCRLEALFRLMRIQESRSPWKVKEKGMRGRESRDSLCRSRSKAGDAGKGLRSGQRRQSPLVTREWANDELGRVFGLSKEEGGIVPRELNA
jgi:hypothetical protein